MSQCRLEYKYNSKLLLDAIKKTNFMKIKEINNDIKAFKTYIYLKEISILYSKCLNDLTNQTLLNELIYKLKEKTNEEWLSIIKYFDFRYLVFNKKYKLNISERDLIEELQGLQTGDIVAFEHIPKECLIYLSKISSIKKPLTSAISKSKKLKLKASGKTKRRKTKRRITKRRKTKRRKKLIKK